MKPAEESEDRKFHGSTQFIIKILHIYIAAMSSLPFLLISLVARAVVFTTMKAQGFTYAGDGDNGKSKIESDLQNQFMIAKALAGTNHDFTRARIYTNISSFLLLSAPFLALN